MMGGALAQNKPFRGWMVLAGAMAAYLGICGNVSYAFGVFLPVMAESMGWGRQALSGVYTFFLVLGGLLGPLAGWSVARFGARRNIVWGNVAAVLGLLGMSQAGALWHVYLCFGLLCGLALAFSEFLPTTTVVNHWFIRRRSWALGLLLASGAAGGFVMPSAISLLMGGIGWRGTWVVLAALQGLLGIGLAGWLIRDTPQEQGQVPDGWIDPPQADGDLVLDASGGDSKSESISLLCRVLKIRALWIQLALFTVLLFAVNMISAHQVAYLRDLRYSPMLSATAFGLMLGASILGRIASGGLGMLVQGRYLASAFMMCMALGILSLMKAKGEGFVYLYSALTGVGFGGMIVILPHMMAQSVGRRLFPRVVGWTTPIVAVVAAASPVLAGYLFDVTGSYAWPFGLAASLLLLGGMLALLIRPDSAHDL
jgi:MFS family permease